MNYLNCLFKVLSDNSLKSLSIVLIACLSSMLLIHREKGLQLIGLSGKDDYPRISFVATVEGNYQNLKNKIIVLPGVKRVVHKNSDSIKEKISLLFKSDILQSAISQGPGYSKFTIYFKSNVSKKSVALIKSYVIKTLSGREVHFGKLIGYKPKSEINKNQVFYFVYGFSLLVLMSIYLLFELNLRKLLYLFQRFQRAKGLTYKVSFLSFFSLVILPTVITLIVYNAFLVKNIITFLVPTTIFYFVISLKRHRWLN